MSVLKRSGAALVASLVAIALLAGCSLPSNTPQNYDDSTEANFMEACTGVAADGSSIADGASEAYCRCAYQWFVDTVPYSDDTAEPGFEGPTFQSYDSELGTDPVVVPDSIRQGLSQACGSS